MHNNGIVHGSTKTGLLFKVCNWSIWWQGVILSDDTAKSIACSIVMSLRDSSPKYSILSTALFQTRNRSCKSVMDAFVRDRKLCQKHLARAVQLRTGVTKVLTLYDFWCVYDIQIYLFICKCSAVYSLINVTDLVRVTWEICTLWLDAGARLRWRKEQRQVDSTTDKHLQNTQHNSTLAHITDSYSTCISTLYVLYV